MNRFKTFFVATLITSLAALAHGEHKPGPHGGQIRMPRAFHTEVVPQGLRQVKVYLLDMKFQSPKTEDSSLSMRFEGSKSLEATCKKENEFFMCSFEEEVLNLKGELHVTATWQKKKGSKVQYLTPL